MVRDAALRGAFMSLFAFLCGIMRVRVRPNCHQKSHQSMLGELDKVRLPFDLPGPVYQRCRVILSLFARSLSVVIGHRLFFERTASKFGPTCLHLYRSLHIYPILLQVVCPDCLLQHRS